MRFEIGPGGIFIILLGLAGLSGGVFGLGLVAGHELAGPEPGSQPVAEAYPLPQAAAAAQPSGASPAASLPAASAPLASTGNVPAAPAVESAGVTPDTAPVNPATAPAAAASRSRAEAPIARAPTRRTAEARNVWPRVQGLWQPWRRR